MSLKSNYIVSGTTVKGIADAIRSKTGETGSIAINQFATKISSITTGSGSNTSDPSTNWDNYKVINCNMNEYLTLQYTETYTKNVIFNVYCNSNDISTIEITSDYFMTLSNNNEDGSTLVRSGYDNGVFSIIQSEPNYNINIVPNYSLDCSDYINVGTYSWDIPAKGVKFIHLSDLSGASVNIKGDVKYTYFTLTSGHDLPIGCDFFVWPQLDTLSQNDLGDGDTIEADDFSDYWIMIYNYKDEEVNCEVIYNFDASCPDCGESGYDTGSYGGCSYCGYYNPGFCPDCMTESQEYYDTGVCPYCNPESSEEEPEE